jgi:hypothetical protein
MAIVTNNENQTYFSGPAWRVFAEHYEFAPKDKVTMWLSEGSNDIFFDNIDPNDYLNSMDSEDECEPRTENDGELVQ